MPPRKQQSAKGRAAPSGKSKAAGSAKRGKSAVKGATTAKKAKKATLPKQLQASAIQQVDRPVPSKDFLVEPEAVQNALAVWDFCYTHSEPLKLSRFTFDMFQQALKDREPPMDPLSREVVKRLLHLIVEQANESNADQDYPAVSNQSFMPTLKAVLKQSREYIPTHLVHPISQFASSPSTSWSALDAVLRGAVLRMLVDEAVTTNAIREHHQTSASQVSSAEKRYQALGQEAQKSEAKVMSALSGIKLPDLGLLERDVAKKQMAVDITSTELAAVVGESRRATLDRKRLTSKLTALQKALAMSQSKLAAKRKDKAFTKYQTEKKRLKHQLSQSMEKLAEADKQLRLLDIRRTDLGQDADKSQYFIFPGDPERLYVAKEGLDDWAYFTTATEIEQLIGSLNKKSKVEASLLSNLQQVEPWLCANMTAKEQLLLQQQQTESTGRASRRKAPSKTTWRTYVNEATD
eukprot:m.69660 g.69660  ORF g.69660 m.69660 type:complete len:464 (+) comp12235_c0_seq1:110-1501(+)